MSSAAELERPRRRLPGSRNEHEIETRLARASGQLNGVASMYASGRYCTEVLDQLAAVGAAIDAIALLILEDHIDVCAGEAVEHGRSDKAAELTDVVRRYLRRR